MFIFLQSIFAILYVASVVGYKQHMKSSALAKCKKEKVYEGNIGYYVVAVFWPLIGLFTLAYDGYKSICK